MMTPKERAAVSIQNESETVSSLSMMRTAMQQALEALEACVEKFYAMKSTGVIGALPMQAVKAAQAITALREALASCRLTTTEQAEQSQLADASLEPVATVKRNEDDSLTFTPLRDFYVVNGMELYAAPLAKQDTHATHVVRTKDLTDDEIHKCMNGNFYNALDFARAVIAANREKNKWK